MSQIEIMVGMGLLTLVGALSLNFFYGSTAQANRVGEQSLNNADARVTAENVAGLLRLADSPTARAGFAAGRFETLTPTRIVFYANVDPTSRTGTAARTPPSRIDIGVDTGRLVEKIYAPKTKYTTYPNPYDYTTNYAATPTVTSVLLRSIANTDVFQYCTADTDPMAKCTAASDALKVASIIIRFTPPAVPGTAAQTVESTVAITGAVS